jgi:diadenosine tetraphosphate (Ap4A) HIT family hydrolase
MLYQHGIRKKRGSLMKEYSCIFCDILENGSDKIKNEILYEDDDFFIIPADGAFVPNYILVISKEHIHSMCYLKSEKKLRLQKIVNKLVSMYFQKYAFHPVIFEHGASYDCSNLSGCCLVHAHLHIVPHQFKLMDEMNKRLELEQADSFDEIYEKCNNKPYLLFIDNNCNKFIKVFSDEVVPSQTFRKWIAEDIGVSTQWDWRIHHFHNNVRKTVKDMGNSLMSVNLSDANVLLKNIYYGRAMDERDEDEIFSEYDVVSKRLKENGMILVNPFNGKPNTYVIDKESGQKVAKENWENMEDADCVIINLSIRGHFYFGCMDEIITAKQKGRFVILIVGDAGADKHHYAHFRSDLIVKTIDEALKFLVTNNNL